MEGKFKTVWAGFGPKPTQLAKKARVGKLGSFVRRLIQREEGQLAEEDEGRPELGGEHPTMMSHDHPTHHDPEVQNRALTSTKNSG